MAIGYRHFNTLLLKHIKFVNLSTTIRSILLNNINNDAIIYEKIVQ